MANDTDKSSKTEEATPKRMQEAHERGQFAKAQEIGVVFVLAAAFVVLVFGARAQAGQVGWATTSIFNHLHDFTVTRESITHWFPWCLKLVLTLLFPMMLACTVASILAGGLQSGFRLTLKALEPNVDKFNPVNGVKKLFGTQSLVQFGVDLLKFIAVGGVVYALLVDIYKDPIFHTPVPAAHVGEFIYETTLRMLIRLLFVIGVIAIINFLYQKHKTRTDMRMTKQEVKDENKQTQGDPKVKQAQRRMAVQMMQKQMLGEVPNADVVVTNPTHFAVALKYERGRDSAPVVLAKGKDLFARRIKEIAANHEVPRVENRPVARLLFRYGQVGKPIPAELYQVVAEILAYVYRTHRYYFHRLRQRRTQPGRELQTT